MGLAPDDQAKGDNIVEHAQNQCAAGKGPSFWHGQAGYGDIGPKHDRRPRDAKGHHSRHGHLHQGRMVGGKRPAPDEGKKKQQAPSFQCQAALGYGGCHAGLCGGRQAHLRANVQQDTGKDHHPAQQHKRIKGLGIKQRADHRDQRQAQKVDGGHKASGGQ